MYRASISTDCRQQGDALRSPPSLSSSVLPCSYQRVPPEGSNARKGTSVPAFEKRKRTRLRSGARAFTNNSERLRAHGMLVKSTGSLRIFAVLGLPWSPLDWGRLCPSCERLTLRHHCGTPAAVLRQACRLPGARRPRRGPLSRMTAIRKILVIGGYGIFGGRPFETCSRPTEPMRRPFEPAVARRPRSLPGSARSDVRLPLRRGRLLAQWTCGVLTQRIRAVPVPVLR
jgi:hypothetical protein